MAVAPDLDLTILTVSYKSRPYLIPNAELTRLLNPGVAYDWHVCENTPEGEPERFALNDHPFASLPEGPAFPTDRPRGAPSYHHAAGLNSLVPKIKSRYVLILDPDFFILRPNWIRDVLRHMESNHLAFFGVPWHPAYIAKYRYFPCIHCWFIDTEQIPIEQLDFTPEIPPYRTDEYPWPRKVLFSHLARPARRFMKTVMNNRWDLLDLKRRWLSMYSSYDTGWRLYKQYGHLYKYKRECLVPTFHPRQHLPSKSFVTGLFHRWVTRQQLAGHPKLELLNLQLTETLLPEHLSYIPKQKGYTTRQTFADAGLPDNPLFEKFFWQKQPFGFHLRAFNKDIRIQKDKLEAFEHAAMATLEQDTEALLAAGMARGQALPAAPPQKTKRKKELAGIS